MGMRGLGLTDPARVRNYFQEFSPPTVHLQNFIDDRGDDHVGAYDFTQLIEQQMTRTRMLGRFCDLLASRLDPGMLQRLHEIDQVEHPSVGVLFGPQYIQKTGAAFLSFANKRPAHSNEAQEELVFRVSELQTAGPEIDHATFRIALGGFKSIFTAAQRGAPESVTGKVAASAYADLQIVRRTALANL